MTFSKLIFFPGAPYYSHQNSLFSCSLSCRLLPIVVCAAMKRLNSWAYLSWTERSIEIWGSPVGVVGCAIRDSKPCRRGSIHRNHYDDLSWPTPTDAIRYESSQMLVVTSTTYYRLCWKNNEWEKSEWKMHTQTYASASKMQPLARSRTVCAGDNLSSGGASQLLCLRSSSNYVSASALWFSKQVKNERRIWSSKIKIHSN